MTQALYDTFANTTGSDQAITAHTSNSGHTWSNISTTYNYYPASVGATGGAFTLDAATSTGFAALSSWTPPSANYGVGALCKFFTSATLEIGVIARMAVVTGNLVGYLGEMSTAANGFVIGKFTSDGTYVSVATVSHTFSPPEQHALYLTAINDGSGGVNLTLYVDGVSTVTYHDTSSAILSAGTAGLRGYSPSGTDSTGAHVLWIQTDPQVATLTAPNPASGAAGAASGNFTLAPEVPWILATTASLSDTLGSAFDPTSLTLAAWSDSATFTITPPMAGSDTVTATVASPALTATAGYTSEPPTVAPSSATLAPGHAQALAASYFAGSSVTWSSSNTAVATVNGSGVVTAVAVGSATITATGVANTGQTATCAITVSVVDTYDCSISGVPSGITPTFSVIYRSSGASATVTGGTPVSTGSGGWIARFQAASGDYLGVWTAGTVVVFDDPVLSEADGGPGASVTLPNSSVSLDYGSVTVGGQCLPPTTTTFWSDSSTLLAASGGYTTMSARFQQAGQPAVRRGITAHAIVGGCHSFTVAPALPSPPTAGYAFVIE